MKILYGIQATGNGHISRSRIMAKYFKEKNIEVTYLFSGRAKEQLFDMEIFGDYLHRQGLTFVIKAGNIDYLASAMGNNLLRFIKDVKSLSLEQYDLVITDFEPVTAWAGKLSKKQTLAIGHQYAFGSATPLAGENSLAKFIMKNFAPAKHSIGLHWAPFDNAILPPIIDVNLQRTANDDFVLVYLPFEDQQLVTKILNQFADKKFVQYSPELTTEQHNNVSQRATCYQGFKRDLSRASAVICNSGFELISECIHLGLPVLTKPINGQMEQESNALALQQLGLATVMLELDEAMIGDWLARYQLNVASAIPNVALEIVDAIIADQALNVPQLAANLWSQLHQETLDALSVNCQIASYD